MDNSITPMSGRSVLVTEKLTNDLIQQRKQISRRQGLIGKGFDKIKSATNLGKSQKGADKIIDRFQKGEVEYSQVEKYLKDYQYTQRDASELTLDILTGLASFCGYSVMQKGVTFATPFLPKEATKVVGKFSKPIGVGVAVLAGMMNKPIFRFIDRIYLKRKEKKDNKTFWKDTLTGALDGAMAPVAALKGAILGIPLVMGENALQRYIFVKKGDKKSTHDFLEQQKDNLVLKGVVTGFAAYKARKFTNSISSWNKAIAKAKENVKDLKPLEKVSVDSDFHELMNSAKLLLDPKLAMDILTSGKSVEEKMKMIEDKNIFLPKFIQTIPENVLGMFGDNLEFMGLKLNVGEVSEIITRFKSNCPQSRTAKEAQDFISKTFGDKYTIINDKALGVGTVAETFLAKDNTTGKEVVLKFLKKGMSAEKIQKDREAFTKLIKANSGENDEKTNFLIRKINTLYDAWNQEVDLAKEMDAAEILGKNAKHYNVAKPIEVKDNIYVMEKASGVQFNEFIDQMTKEGKKISEKEMVSLMRNYFQVFFEQLLSVPKKGSKVMHADPHPGNVFIDLTNKEKPFTFIDTGNVLRYTPEEAIENVLNHLDYFIGNAKGIAKALLRNANLPEGMTKEQAQNLVEQGLKEKAYNGHTNLLDGQIFQNINNIGLKIMEDNGIIPNQNNTNLLKAEVTYLSNITCLKDIHKIIDRNGERIQEKEAKEQAELMLNEIKESIINSAINNKVYTSKQLKERLNYIEKNKEQFYSTILSFAESLKM